MNPALRLPSHGDPSEKTARPTIENGLALAKSKSGPDQIWCALAILENNNRNNNDFSKIDIGWLDWRRQTGRVRVARCGREIEWDWMEMKITWIISNNDVLNQFRSQEVWFGNGVYGVCGLKQKKKKGTNSDSRIVMCGQRNKRKIVPEVRSDSRMMSRSSFTNHIGLDFAPKYPLPDLSQLNSNAKRFKVSWMT